ncbi:flagellar hook-associated protein FlgK [Amaricoccus tamworthensis]|uniref:flagellar hook-associated protein FlgK n=1 Tax=Amaricoccus tamworthensis TaxID=57002 RepID=UPI003C7ED08F
MSLNTALLNASSGLRANARLVDGISDNVANALTEGFARREVDLTSTVINGYGAGVGINGTNRAEHVRMTAERRAVEAPLGASHTISEAWERMLNVVGEPGAEGSLGEMVNALESNLITLASTPQSATEQAATVQAAQNLVNSLNAISAENDSIRTDAELEIARQVDTVNAALHDIDDLNNRIVHMTNTGGDYNALMDERDRKIDEIATIIPVSVVRQDRNQVAVYSSNGGVLLNGKVYELNFEPKAGGVTTEMQVGVALNYLQQDRGANIGFEDIAAGTGSGLLDGGSLGALFELRDSVVPEYQGEIDAYAVDLIERFRDLMPAGFLDGSGEGLFVDSAGTGVAVGMSNRIEINAAVDPAQGGEVWRIRDGLGAAVEGETGFGDYIEAMSDALAVARTPTGFALQTNAASSSAFAGEIASYFAGEAYRADSDLAYLNGLSETLAENEINIIGVDTDHELQRLMVVEEAYAANAKVLSVLDELMQLLLGV